MIRAVLLISKIHHLRFIRMINQLGIFRVLFLLGIGIYTIKATTKPGMLIWQALLLVSMIVQSHFKRRDFVLLNNLELNRPAYFVLLYTLFVSPFLILYLLWSDFSAFTILLSGIIFASLITQPLKKPQKIRIPAFRSVPAASWEWRVGLRQYLLVFIIAYLIPAVFYRQEYLFAASVLLIAITTNSFHNYHESLYMMASVKSSPTAYFWYKVLMQCLLFSLLALPLLISSLLLYPEDIRPVLLLFFNCLIVQIFVVSIKYAGYMPGQKSPYNQGLSFLLNFSFVVPALVPVPIIMAAVFSRKAIAQLKLITG
jgi:hypothetical protein